MRGLIPTIGTIRYAGIAFDVPNTKGSKPERVAFSAKEVELTAEKPLNGIPTNVRLGVQNLAMALPQESDDETIQELVGMNYRSIDVSWRIAAAWSEQMREVSYETLFDGAGMGRLSLKALFGGIEREAFDPDMTNAIVSLVGATLKTIDVTLDNTGIVDRLIERQAREANKTPQVMRREFAVGVAAMVPVVLGPGDQSRALGQALARFVAKPVRLRVSAKAKSPQGLDVTDLMALDQVSPGKILQKIDLKAVTEDKF